MKIGFDAKRAALNATGLGNYSRMVIEALACQYESMPMVLYTPQVRGTMLDALKAHSNVTVALPQRARLGQAWWRSVGGMTRQAVDDGCDLLHGLAGELPLDVSRHHIASVVTIHDLIFDVFPQLYSPIDRRIYRYKALKACQHASRIIAVSECTRRDIILRLHIDPGLVDVVYQGCNPIYSQPVSPEQCQQLRDQLQLPERYLINVGTIEPRKNILLAVKALEHIDDHDLALVIIGRRTKYADEVENYAATHGLSSRVRILTDVPTASLPALYHGAVGMVYPSRYEGFGIPIIEAQSCGIPVIAATGSCLEEAAGRDGAIMVNPDNDDQMVDAINQLTGNSDLVAGLVAAGHNNIKRFTPAIVAQSTMAVYKAALDNV